jgi:hypothetical protein
MGIVIGDVCQTPGHMYLVGIWENMAASGRKWDINF